MKHFLLSLIFACAVVTTCHADGIPEPGLVMYGSVTNTAGSFVLMSGGVQWNASGGGSSASVAATIANVNGQYFYLAQIPFETRAASSTTFTPKPNTLPLTDTTTSFTRSASVMGTNATMAPPALGTFNFSKGDRGKVERVDLLVNLPGVGLAPNADDDHDGVPNWAEQIAGTNPNDPNSVFRASTDIQPAPGGGLTIKWSSVAGHNYAVHCTKGLEQPFICLSSNLPATAPLNQYTDASATNAGPYFYRIQVNP